MKNNRIDVSDKTAISMPMKNLLGIISAVAIGVYAFFGIQETLNKHSTTLELMEKDLEQNSEFRIKYPRGELAFLPLSRLVQHSRTFQSCIPGLQPLGSHRA